MVYEMLSPVPVKKRHRPTLVCLNCRRRKTKCDRGKPSCSNCLKLGETCVYSEDTDENASKKVRYEYMDDLGLPEFINMAPKGLHLLSKRSASWFNGLFSDIAICDRDPYLRITNAVIDILRKSASKGIDRSERDTVLQLPNSLKTVTMYNRSEKSEDQLYHQIAREFSALRSAPIPETYVPYEYEFWSKYYPYFVDKIHPLVPVFNLIELKDLLEKFFQRQKDHPGKLNDKVHESTLLMLTYLIINFFLLEFDSHNRLIQDHINIIKKWLVQSKWFQKTTLLQLRVWLVLRFHNWCTYHDNDGNRMNANDGLMGLIMGHCASLGITWQLWTNIDSDECKNIWINALHWDRKLAVLNGNDTFNGRTMRVPELPNDHLVLKFLKCCVDDPTHVNYKLAIEILNKLNFEEQNPMVTWEWKVIVAVTKLQINHGRLNHINEGISAVIASLEDLITLWNEHFIRPLAPVSYSSRIIEISMNKALVLLPAIILRARNPCKQKILQLMDKILTTYFNEFPYYYHVFKRLFKYKLTLNLINREDSLDHMLTILKHENHQVLEKLGITSKDAEMSDDDVIKVWNARFSFTEKVVNLKVEMMCKNYEPNLFSSSYQHALEKLEERHSAKADAIDVTQFLQQVFDSTDFDLFYGMDVGELPKMDSILP